MSSETEKTIVGGLVKNVGGESPRQSPDNTHRGKKELAFQAGPTPKSHVVKKGAVKLVGGAVSTAAKPIPVVPALVSGVTNKATSSLDHQERTRKADEVAKSPNPHVSAGADELRAMAKEQKKQDDAGTAAGMATASIVQAPGAFSAGKQAGKTASAQRPAYKGAKSKLESREGAIGSINRIPSAKEAVKQRPPDVKKHAKELSKAVKKKGKK